MMKSGAMIKKKKKTITPMKLSLKVCNLDKLSHGRFDWHT